MGLAVFGIVLVTAAAVLGYGVVIYNGLVSLSHAMERAWANIDVLLKQRHDELPKLVETVKGYMQHEREVLTGLTEARTRFAGAQTVNEKGDADGAVQQALSRLFAVAENYPELKADGAFSGLQERISALEEQIADRREFYNHSVNAYNVRIEQLPDLFVARFLTYSAADLFEVSRADRADVRISF
ncbi:MAG: LemA family protein [Deltaproteobacteria bacterium]|nr:LemA family protein [Deltaproteobacteria bacterium]MBW2413003.1 LemA family protein [Deltaproteobacteria bacterium]